MAEEQDAKRKQLEEFRSFRISKRRKKKKPRSDEKKGSQNSELFCM